LTQKTLFSQQGPISVVMDFLKIPDTAKPHAGIGNMSSAASNIIFKEMPDFDSSSNGAFPPSTGFSDFWAPRINCETI